MSKSTKELLQMPSFPTNMMQKPPGWSQCSFFKQCFIPMTKLPKMIRIKANFISIVAAVQVFKAKIYDLSIKTSKRLFEFVIDFLDLNPNQTFAKSSFYPNNRSQSGL